MFAQRKVTKRKRAPWSAPANTAGPLAPRSPQRVRRRDLPVAAAHARDPSLAPAGPRFGFTRRSACPRGFGKHHLAMGFEVGCSHPRSARRVPQPHRELLSETVFEPEARCSAPGELVERPVGRGTEGDVARSGGALLWVLSCRDKKVPRPRLREPDSNTSPKATQNQTPETEGTNNQIGRGERI